MNHFDKTVEQEPGIAKLLASMPEHLLDRCVLRKLNADTTLMKKDALLTYVYIVVKGQFVVINEFENGHIYSFATIKALDFIGDLEAIAEEKRIAVTIKAKTNCEILAIPVDAFKEWLKVKPDFLAYVAKELAKKLYPTSRENGNFLFLSGYVKLQIYLVKYIDQLSVKKEHITILKSRQQISDELGLSIKTINRNVLKLVEAGYVNLIKGKMTISIEQYKEMKMLTE